jgi:hypothetical protein
MNGEKIVVSKRFQKNTLALYNYLKNILLKLLTNSLIPYNTGLTNLYLSSLYMTKLFSRV